MNKLAKILVPTDFSPAGERALTQASVIAARTGAELHVVHVQVFPLGKYGWIGMPDVEAVERSIADHVREDLGKAVQKLRQPVVHEVIRDIREAPAIVRYAEERTIDLIVMGTHARKGVKRMLLGSVAAAVVRHSSVSVMVIGPEHEQSGDSPQRVLAPVDFSENSKVALRQAAAIAQQHAAELIALHVVEPPKFVPYVGMIESPEESHEHAMRALDDLLDGVDLPRPPAQRLVVTGHPDEQIAAQARELDVDLIVMGTVGLSGVERLLLGSTTERVLRDAPCAVLAHRGAVLENL